MPPKPLMCAADTLARDLSDRTYVVTGANSGIGLEVTRQLAKQGASVVMGCRNLDAATGIAREIAGETGAHVRAMALDLGRLASVRSFADEVIREVPTLDGLVNNAGVMNTPEGKTEDGFETQFGVNHLGPFLLTELLVAHLQNSAPSRVIWTSSVYHERGELDFEDLQWERRRYRGFQAYHDSKLAAVMSARHLGKRLAGRGVTSVSLHPGWAQSNLARNTMPLWVQNYALYPVLKLMGMISPWECAQTTLHCLLDDGVPDHNGAYFSQCSQLYKDRANRGGGWPMVSPHPAARDDDLGDRLYDVSARLVGL